MVSSRVKNHFAYLWWAYLLAGGAIIATLVTVYSNLAQPKKSETLVLTYLGSGLDSAKLEADCYQDKEKITAKTIKQINVEALTIDAPSTFDSVIRARTSKGVDLFVIESALLTKYQVDIPSYFASVNETRFYEYFTNPIAIDSKIYGSTVEKASRLGKHYSGESSLNLYFNTHSENMQYLFEKGDGKTGIEFASYLLGDANV